jgi:hypothetical protein
LNQGSCEVKEPEEIKLFQWICMGDSPRSRAHKLAGREAYTAWRGSTSLALIWGLSFHGTSKEINHCHYCQYYYYHH